MKTSFNTSDKHAIRSIKKINKRIEIIGSHNSNLNNMGSVSRRSVFTVLEQYYAQVAMTFIDDINDLDMLVMRNPDLVVLGMNHLRVGTDNAKLWIATYLQDHGIHFTGSNDVALKLQKDKSAAKQAVLDAGLNSSAFIVVPKGQQVPQQDLRFPLFVKPAEGGNSKGIDEMSVVYSRQALVSKVQSVHQESGPGALVEEYLPGREFSVAVVRQLGSDSILALPIEILAPSDSNGNTFLSEAVKKTDTEHVIPIADPILKAVVNDLAINVFHALDAKDYGRIDIRLDVDGKPSFIEANLRPGVSDHGYLSRCFYLNGRIDYTDMILMIVSLGLERAAASK